MDQGVIECLKKRYKKKLLSENLNKIECENKRLVDVLKTINIKDVIYVMESFEKVPTSTTVKSYSKTWPYIEKSVETNASDNPLID